MTKATKEIHGDKILLRVLMALIAACLLFILTMMAIALQYNGKWKMQAYGLCFNVTAGYVRTYEVTDNYYTRCSLYDGVIINGTLYSGMGKFKLDKDKNQLYLIDRGSQMIYRTDLQTSDYFSHLTKLNSSDSVAKFKMYYEIFKENYAFADFYGVDFDSEYQKYSKFITADTSDDTLYQYMCKMVEGLDDGHVEVNFKGKEYSPSDCVPHWITDKAEQNKLGNVIKSIYVKDYYKFNNCYIRYGTLRNDIGYINITGMGMEELDKSATTRKAMDKVMKKFENKKTIVIDLRFCGGGYDETALVISGYFTQKPYLAYMKQAYYKGNFTKLQNVYVNPNKLNFIGNVVVLTSGYTISAGEVLLRSLTANKDNHIKLVGEKTAGYYSDALTKTLPGGFDFRMSTERYLGPDNSIFEGHGTVPEVEIPVSVEAAEQGQDKALDYVLVNY